MVMQNKPRFATRPGRFGSCRPGALRPRRGCSSPFSPVGPSFIRNAITVVAVVAMFPVILVRVLRDAMRTARDFHARRDSFYPDRGRVRVREGETINSNGGGA